MQNIGLIGVGKAGKMFFDSLHSKGYSVTCFDRGHKIEYVKEQGATLVDTPGKVVELTDTILIAVPGSTEVEAVMQGEDGILNALEEGQTVIDTTTTKIETANKYSSKCSSIGVSWINAPWTSAAPIDDLVMIVGGSDKEYSKSKDILETISKQHIHINTVKKAMLLKYLLQIRYAANMAVDAEIVELARTADLDPSHLNSFFGMDVSEKLFEDDYEPSQEGMGSLEMWDKDLGYAIEYGNGNIPNENGVAMPLTSAVHAAYKYSNRTTGSNKKHASAVSKYWKTLNSR